MSLTTKLTTLAVLSLLLVTTGCGLKNNQTQGVPTSGFTLSVIKSTANTRTALYSGPEDALSISELLQKAKVPFKSELHGDSEVITELDGVVNTMSKEWHLYVNNKAVVFAKDLNAITVHPADQIEWRYEPPTP